MLGVALAVAVSLLLLVGPELWTRPFWMDELATYWVTNHPSPVAVVGHIARGGEWSPPFFHLTVWAVRTVAGDLSPVALRVIALAFTLSALCFVYATLRRRFDASSSVAGLLVVVAHPLLTEHAFEGRMYAPWLACAAGYAWSLGVDADRMPSRRRDVAQAVSAVLLCTVHWFGVLSMGLAAVAAMYTLPRTWRYRARFLAPSLAGVAAVLICAPLIVAQRRSAAGILWVPDVNVAQVMERVRLFFPAAVVVLIAALVVVRFAGARRPADTAPRGLTLALDTGTAALMSLVLMPAVLLVVSLLVQPSMLPRYMIVALLGWAVPIALAVELLGVRARGVVATLALLIAARHAAAAVTQRRDYARQVDATARAVQQARATGLPVVFQALHPMYPAALGTPGQPRLARFVAVPDSTIARLYVDDRLDYLRRHYRLEREIGREHARLFGFPPSVAQAELDSTARFILVAADTSLPPGYQDARLWGRIVFPNHQVSRLTPMLALFQRQTLAARREP